MTLTMRRVLTQQDVEILSKRSLDSPKTSMNLVQSPDDYLSKVAGFIPAEIVSAYVVLNGLLNEPLASSATLQWFVFIALIVLTAVYTWQASNENGLPIAYLQIILSTASFIVWVFALGGPFLVLEWYLPIYGSILMVFFTLIIPYFIK